MASNSMPVVARNVSTALRSVCSGDDSKGCPFLLKKEQSMHNVGSSLKGSTKAVEKRGNT